MRYAIRCWTISIVILLAGAVAAFGQGTTITLLHVNDTHSHLDSYGPKNASLDGTIGGIARAATIIGTEKASSPNVLLLHAGDLSVGDPFYNTYFGVPEYQIMLQLGFDAMTVGNHEFDFGPVALNDVLGTAFAGGSFPLISANLDMDAFPALKTWIRPGIIREVGGVRVGIFGMTVPNNPTNNPAPVVVSDNLVPIIQHMADTLRAQGAEVVILLSHLGIYLDTLVIPATTGIDFVIGGHDHYLFPQPVKVSNAAGAMVPIFQAGEFYRYIGKLRFTVDHGSVTLDDYSILSVDASVPPEPSIQAVIDNLKQGIVAKYGDIYHTVVGRAIRDVDKSFDEERPLRGTPMGNLVTDAYRAKTGTPIAIDVLGLISEKLYAGPIVGADVFRSLSYGYDTATGLGLKLAKLKIRGSELLKGLEVTLSQLETGTDFFPQVSGMTFTYDSRQPAGQRVILSSVRVHGRQFDPETVYDVTVNEGIAMLLPMLGVTAEEIIPLPDFEYIVVRDYIHQRHMINYMPEARIMDAAAGRRHGRGPMNGVAWDGDHRPGDRHSRSYPNPFNPATVIMYSLPGSADVTLIVYNALGQDVAELQKGLAAPGLHRVTWNASGMPAGVYFYRLTARAAGNETISESGKMLLVR